MTLESAPRQSRCYHVIDRAKNFVFTDEVETLSSVAFAAKPFVDPVPPQPPTARSDSAFTSITDRIAPSSGPYRWADEAFSPPPVRPIDAAVTDAVETPRDPYADLSPLQALERRTQLYAAWSADFRRRWTAVSTHYERVVNASTESRSPARRAM